MTKIKLTKQLIESIPYREKGQALYHDTDLSGFGLIVGRQSKTFFVQRDVKFRTVRVTIGRYGVFTAEQARGEARELLLRMTKGENPNLTKKAELQQQVTVEHAFKHYLGGKKNLSDTIHYQAKRCQEDWFKDWLSTPLTQLTSTMALKRHRELGERYGEATSNQALKMLGTVYNYIALSHETLPTNPINILTRSKSWFEENRRTNYIKPTQLKPWFDGLMLIECSTIRDYLQLLLFTGMRRNEGLTLTWNNIDFDERTILIAETKNGKPLTIPMSSYIEELLKERKKRTGNCEWVFPSHSSSGHLVEPKKSMAKITKVSGVPFMLHDLRRTFVTYAESLDISTIAIKELVNHSESRDITARYVIMNPERLREPMEKVSNYILGLIQ